MILKIDLLILLMFQGIQQDYSMIRMMRIIKQVLPEQYDEGADDGLEQLILIT